MLRSVILAEVSDVARLCDCLDGRGGVVDLPDGYGEVPECVYERLAGELLALTHLCGAGVIDRQECCAGVMAVVNVAFLMGRQYGKLEAAAGADVVADVARSAGVLHDR